MVWESGKPPSPICCDLMKAQNSQTPTRCSSFVPALSVLTSWVVSGETATTPRQEPRVGYVKPVVLNASPPPVDKLSRFSRFSVSTMVRLFLYTYFFQQIHFEHIYAQGTQWSSEDVQISQWMGFLPNGVYGLVRWGRTSQMMKTNM